MKKFTPLVLALGICATAGTAAIAQNIPPHRMVLPSDLTWSDVPSLPPGAKIAVIEGPMNQAVPFTIRLKFPAGYVLPAHSHPAIERVTVLSGTFNMGTGDRFEKSRTHALPAGAIAIMQSGTNHFAWTSDETIVQLHGTGPWGITYVNPNDDPRKKQAGLPGSGNTAAAGR
jgi:quercetin dioxygenase-like cupin family protein